MSYPDTLLLIDGEWCKAASGRTLPVVNPATGQEIGRVAHAGTEDLDRALAAVDRTFQDWKRFGAFERSKIMRKAADILRARADTVAAIMTAEQGKPLAEAKVEVLGACDTIDWFAEEARRAYGQVIPARRPGVTQITVKEAVGPVAAFTPWNFPINQVVRKVSAALATGCTIIVKAPEETPASPAELIRAFVEAGVPAGVLNLVYGDPAEISGYLIPHPVIKKISFTGSTPVGKMLMGLAGQHMKRATMELGGHAPVLIFDDADVEAAIEGMLGAKQRNAGQVCVSPTRFLVQEGVADAFTEGFTEVYSKLKVGDPTEAGTQMGPLANDRRIPALTAMIEDAVAKGAKLKAGGKRIGNAGNFFEPTVITDVPTDALMMNDEPFGPLAIVNRYETEDEIFAEANRLPFGLASYAWTTSSRRAQRLQEEVRAGMLTINHLGLSMPELPFGGIGDSGMGTEGGSEAIESYLETRLVTRLG
ncbi:NAD-dependent succinate-semialdehyde dehydrogenase [Oceanicola sp. S124]|uniref:NAD-dependent succinate-semialdehyde dehydrogenase n=1 Tax=Oceanicola sp. S124 TaxID=1042378 RepID=UPI00025596AC|nr:NAD-dependent succinate-semialdehyde dehydrogenase [Oceanicola sp. S124]